jgi:hypothetical protein
MFSSRPVVLDGVKLRGKRYFALENSVPDDKTKTRPQDAAKVNVHEKYELEYWTKEFGVTPDQLRAAVARVGTSARAVEQQLKRR